nr:C3 [Trifolium virus 1]
MEDQHTIQTARSPEGTLTWQITSPREEFLRNEEYLELQEEVLGSLGIPSGHPSSPNLHPSPSSSPDADQNNHTRMQRNSGTWSTLQTESGQNHHLCINPDGHIFLMSPRPLETGQTQTSSL